MEKEENKQGQPMGTESKSNDEKSVKISSETGNAILRLLKKIFNIKVLTAIAGAVAAVAAVLTFIYAIEHPIKKLKREINEEAQIIEATFHPNEIIIDSLSTPDVQLIKDFQTSSLRMASYWKSINSMQPISKYETTDLSMILSVVTSQLSTINNFDTESKNTLSNTISILKYGQQNNIPQYTPFADKIMILYEQAGRRDIIFDETKKTVMEDLSKVLAESLTNPNKLNSKRIVKSVKPIEKIYDNKDVLRYIHSLFSCTIELNAYYMDYLNNSGQQ